MRQKIIKKPSELTQQFAAAGYCYKHNWDFIAQPVSIEIPGLSVEEYTHIAGQAQPTAQEEFEEFIKSTGFSYIKVSQEDMYEYETGNYPSFRAWLNEICEKTGRDPGADLLIVSSCVKDLNSAQRKEIQHGFSPDRIIDYVREMAVVLKKRPEAKVDNHSLEVLTQLIQHAQQNPGTLAWKNMFWDPHPVTGFRAYKTLRSTTVPEINPQDISSATGSGAYRKNTATTKNSLEGFTILVEQKFEHESQMEIDRATRHFLNLNRASQKIITPFNFSPVRDLSNTRFLPENRKLGNSHHAKRFKQTMSSVEGWSRSLYQRINHDAGMDVLMCPQCEGLGPKGKEYIIPARLTYVPTYKEILGEITNSGRAAHKGAARAVLSAIAESNILPKKERYALLELGFG